VTARPGAGALRETLAVQLGRMRALLQASRTGVYVLDEVGGVLRALCHDGSAVPMNALWSRVYLDERLPITEAVRTRRATVHEPAPAGPAHPGLAGLPGAEGRLACLPLIDDGRVVGVVSAVDCRAPLPAGTLERLAPHTEALTAAVRAHLDDLLAAADPPAAAPPPPPPYAPAPALDEHQIRAAVSCGTFCWRLDEDVVSLDSLAMSVFGTRTPYTGSPVPLLGHIHRADFPLLRRTLAKAAAEHGAFALQYRVLRHDGAQRWVEARGRAVSDRAGRPVLAGTLTDTTGRPTWPQLAAGPVDSMPDGLAVMDGDWHLVYANDTCARLAGMGRGDLVGRHVGELLAQLDRAVWEPQLRRVAQTRRQATFDAFFPAARRWYEVRAGIQSGGLAIYLRDIHARRTAAARDRDRAQRRETSAAFAAALGSTLGVDDVIRVVEQRLAGTLECDGVAMHVAAEGRLRLIAAAGYTASGLAQLRTLDIDDHGPIARCAVDQRLRAYPTGEDILEEYPYLRRTVEETTTGALVVAPLVREGTCLGVLCARYDTPRAFPDRRLAFIEGACDLITQALYRAHRYDAELSLAGRLRKDVLSTPPDTVPGLELATEYRAAGVGLAVGGDWFDVIPLIRGRVGLVVGDVEGHDAHAVGGMSTVRTAVRAYASEGYGPAAILGRVNRLVSDLDPDLLATCCYAELDPATGGARIARAGHPAPIMGRGAGKPALMDLPAGLPLGVDPREAYRAVRLSVPAGTLLALYSDGLVESRAVSIDVGTDRLLDALAENAHLPVRELAHGIVARHLERAVLGDDVTLLLARSVPGAAGAPAPGGEPRDRGEQDDGPGGAPQEEERPPAPGPPPPGRPGDPLPQEGPPGGRGAPDPARIARRWRADGPLFGGPMRHPHGGSGGSEGSGEPEESDGPGG
jgi:PAS domain S-box-containing protein